jgi:hypothetical protein
MKNFCINIFFFSVVICSPTLYAQFTGGNYICYYLINSEIQKTMEENEKQKEMRNKQLTNLGLESANKEEWKKYREVTEKIRGRLNNLSFAIQSIPTSVNIVKEIDKIYELQSKIYNELADAPIWIPLALSGQYEFINSLQMDIRLMAGIVLSYGTINGMEKAERKILLDYAQGEIKGLRQQSYSTLQKIINAKRKMKLRNNLFQQWVNRDKKIIQDIINNANLY